MAHSQLMVYDSGIYLFCKGTCFCSASVMCRLKTWCVKSPRELAQFVIYLVDEALTFARARALTAAAMDD